MKAYIDLLESLLVTEFDKIPERAKKLVKSYPNIVSQGIIQGNRSLRAIALILDDLDRKNNNGPGPAPVPENAHKYK